MGVLVGNPRKAAAYPVGRRMDVLAREKKQESYLVHLTRRLLENYRALLDMAEYTRM
ncbi:MAG: hypothetical protein K6T29_04465 [Peptococcaceae bacterium]|nr:hypothetical protein [Peptococcaceae bacterium]